MDEHGANANVVVQVVTATLNNNHIEYLLLLIIFWYREVNPNCGSL
jgi:hypothetical protein